MSAPKLILKLLLLLVFTCTQKNLMAQQEGDWGLAVNGNYSQPVGTLNGWFKGTISYAAFAGQQIDSKWFVEGGIENTEYSEENLSGYAKGKVALSLHHFGIILNGRYTLAEFSIIKPYFNLGAGLYYWEGIRGEIQADSTLTPVLPFIDEKKLQEWNWGGHAGLGMEFKITSALSVDIVANYRFIVGDLWPTLQPHIELESVSGFQSVNTAIFIRYYL